MKDDSYKILPTLTLLKGDKKAVKESTQEISLLSWNNDSSEDVEQVDNREEHIACPFCGTTFESFQKKGMFGCAVCYETFSSHIAALVRRIQEGERHMGKVPNRGHGVFSTAQKVRQLQQHLAQAVVNHNQKEEAHLRQLIDSLDEGIGK